MRICYPRSMCNRSFLILHASTQAHCGYSYYDVRNKCSTWNANANAKMWREKQQAKHHVWDCVTSRPTRQKIELQDVEWDRSNAQIFSRKGSLGRTWCMESPYPIGIRLNSSFEAPFLGATALCCVVVKPSFCFLRQKGENNQESATCVESSAANIGSRKTVVIVFKRQQCALLDSETNHGTWDSLMTLLRWNQRPCAHGWCDFSRWI